MIIHMPTESEYLRIMIFLNDATEPVNVIYQTAEDGLADTVKPRLEAANADCSRISIIDESDKDSH